MVRFLSISLVTKILINYHMQNRAEFLFAAQPWGFWGQDPSNAQLNPCGGSLFELQWQRRADLRCGHIFGWHASEDFTRFFSAFAACNSLHCPKR